MESIVDHIPKHPNVKICTHAVIVLPV